jgi:hypothetical protein
MRSPRRTARIFISTLATLVVLGAGEAAQAACYSAGEQLSGQALSQFINDPSRLLTQYPSGGPQMISLIRDLVASDPGTLSLIINLNAKANPDQLQAIGTGLGQAALVCKRTAQPFSNEIQRMAIATNNQPLTQAFAGVMGDQFLGLADPSVGGGGAGVTGQVGSVSGVGAGAAPFSLTTAVATSTGSGHTFTFSSSSTAGTAGTASSSGNSAGLPGVAGTASSLGNSAGLAGLAGPTAPGSASNLPGPTSSGGPSSLIVSNSLGGPNNSVSPHSNISKSTSPYLP